MSDHIPDVTKMINDGGPAFPHKTQWDGITPAINYHGISMRDYFAASALQGMMSEYDPEDELENHIAIWSYKAADAMLRARETKP
jgi:hypothetical protein